MPDLELVVEEWLAPDHGEPEIRAATGSLRITARDVAGPEVAPVTITEVEDRVAQTVRPHIRVPLVPLAEWLWMNWWRLRWEGRPAHPTLDWYEAHRLSAIGGDTPWPPLELWSDGDSIHLEMDAEAAADVSALRYLRQVHVDIAAVELEAAIERFLDTVEGRLATTRSSYRDVSELRRELAEERSQPSVARACRWQALAGTDPGSAAEDWLSRAEDVGERAGDEVMASLPELDGGLDQAQELVRAMKRSATAIDLSWVTPDATAHDALGGERPWERGARLAKTLGHQTRRRGRRAQATSPPGQPMGAQAIAPRVLLRAQPAARQISTSRAHCSALRLFFAMRVLYRQPLRGALSSRRRPRRTLHARACHPGRHRTRRRSAGRLPGSGSQMWSWIGKWTLWIGRDTNSGACR